LSFIFVHVQFITARLRRQVLPSKGDVFYETVSMLL
jgi:hypothetical protein